MTLVLGVDCSTQATKVEIRDAETGTLLAEGRAPHPATTPPVSEQHPEVWADALRSACAAAGVDARRPAAVSVAGQQHGLVVLDRQKRVLRPAKLWNDTESAVDAAHLVAAVGADYWARACGVVPVASFTVSKLAWLRRVEPSCFDRTEYVLLPHDWLTMTLTGDPATDRGDASGTGYWSPFTEAWRTDLLDLVDPARRWSEMLPPVLGPSDAAGQWNGAVVAAGTGDNMATALALGLDVGDVAVSIGTSGTVFAVSAKPVADASGAVAGFADAAGGYLPLVCTLNATRVTDAFARVLGMADDRQRFDQLALDASPGASGLTLVPYLDGERTPNRPWATGTLTGLRSDVSAADVARAAVEGVVCGLLDGLAALTAAGVPTGGRLFLVGGGSRSHAYRQVLADLSQRTVVVPRRTDQVARGACIQAAAALHRRSPREVATAWGLGETVAVDPSCSADNAADVLTRYQACRALPDLAEVEA
ncbi:MAG: xylulokinase [Microthrixaceae bacterium]